MKLRDLEREVVALLEEFQDKEKAFAHIVKVGRTQLQDAVLVTLGREIMPRRSRATAGASTNARRGCAC